jgi:bifunctional DNase/RNase
MAGGNPTACGPLTPKTVPLCVPRAEALTNTLKHAPGATAEVRVAYLPGQVELEVTDDAGHRALPVRLPAHAGAFWRLLARADDRGQEHHDDDAGEMTGQLLHAAGITVTAVTVTDLGPAVTATRVDIALPGGTRQVTTRLADGLALAVITGAPLAVEDLVMDRLAEPITGPDPLGPFRSRQQSPPGPPEHTRFEPRNLAFTDGLHR